MCLTILHPCASIDDIRNISAELGSDISLRCEIPHLPTNAVVTWVYRQRQEHSARNSPPTKWLPLYANSRRLTQNGLRFALDFTGYTAMGGHHTSILTINSLTNSDEGVYMCKSNHKHSKTVIFDVHVVAAMSIYPQDGIIELQQNDFWLNYPINFTCTIRNSNVNKKHLLWYHNNQEIRNNSLNHYHRHTTSSHTLIGYPQHTTDEARLTLIIRHLLANDSGAYTCKYKQITKQVNLVFTSDARV
ncbi:unnamed protein product [Didymodactylos carnosus]|uniref:Ig-like domain-containing protein n=1 Tax=Didymodactylos carnosus TaxID=1234261 RepID=A0A814F1B8_9BILA|nr:unnamed protein product [Didymodactylos carnosus]CAF0975124.1 unnamed protein product [Didymodactylos carnosus]CAF3576504.1 unnamed protein product [Didymodactylos carnosus]CAF3747957.1 unnamed protein product [Didymodactylos carnosus]